MQMPVEGWWSTALSIETEGDCAEKLYAWSFFSFRLAPWQWSQQFVQGVNRCFNPAFSLSGTRQLGGLGEGMKKVSLKQRPKRRKTRGFFVRPETWKVLVFVARAIVEIVKIVGRFF